MKKIKSEVKIALMLALGAIAMIVGLIIGDWAKTPAGWTFGDILAWTGLASFVGGIVWLFLMSGRADKQ